MGGRKKIVNKIKVVDRKSRSVRAGLNFPVGRIHRFLRKGKYADRISAGAPVYLAALMDFLTCELLELAGNVTIDGRRSRIKPRDINCVILLDNELNKLLSNVTIPQGGILPHVYPFLFPKNMHTT